MAVVFFDIGGTLADASITPDGALSFRPLPRVREALAAVAHERLGILSNPGPTETDRRRAAAALAATFDVFTDPTLVRWGSKTTRAIFDAAVAAAGVDAKDCVFVGEDPEERARAREAGMRCVAHPVLARAGVEDRPVFSVRIDAVAGPRISPVASLAPGFPPSLRSPQELAAVVNASEVVPVNVGAAEVLAMATERGAQAVRGAGFAVTVLDTVDASGSAVPTDAV